MNTSTRGLIDRLYVKTLNRNKNNNDLDDTEVLLYLNEATREVFRWFSLYMPSYIRKRIEYLAIGGETIVPLSTPAVLVQSLFVNGKQFYQDGDMVPHRRRVADVLFRLESFTDIVFEKYEIKSGDTFVINITPAELPVLAYHKEATEYLETETDKSLFPHMWDDPIIEHAMISYEAARGMMQDAENSQRSRWQMQVMTLFSDAIPPTSVGEYYQGYAPRGDML